MWERSFINKAIMTIPYNITARSMVADMKKMLVQVFCKKDDCTWYSDSEKNNKPCLSHKNINLLITTLRWVVENDFSKIKKK